MRLFYNRDRASFYYLNATQFLGSLNDNIFKLLIVFMLIHFKGQAAASSILAFTGATFVIPFLLFSSASGILADRISKRKILVSMKAFELIITILATVAIYYKSEFGVYVLLFLLAAESAIFGPSKYGIIPEIVPSSKLSKANSILTSLTYSAVILGSFLAACITDLSNKNFVLASTACIFIAIVGFITSLKIKKTPKKGSTTKINPIFFYEIYKTMCLSYKRKHLLPAIFGSGYFLYMAGFVQLNIIPFAIQSLHFSDVGGAYLFLPTAIGIAIGSLIAGKVSKDKVEIGLSCFAGFALSILLILLDVFSFSVIASIIILILLGIFGGMFLIPFDAFIQVNSPEKKRGQIIATGNFMSFLGVLFASITLILISDVFNISASKGFTIVGVITFIFNFFNTGKLSELFFPYFSNKILKHFYTVELNEEIPKNSAIVLEEHSWRQAFSLFSKVNNLKIICSGKRLKNFPFYNNIFNSISIVREGKSPYSEIKNALSKIKAKDATYCILLRKPIEKKELSKIFSSNTTVYSLIGKKTVSKNKFLGMKIKKTTYNASIAKV
jgi:acyl-[acyl-carrier-protein]-phospholipid O-acyltransferase / long-chain-fatty-acid--[acyl-carrier-protein] ligase